MDTSENFVMKDLASECTEFDFLEEGINDDLRNSLLEHKKEWLENLHDVAWCCDLMAGMNLSSTPKSEWLQMVINKNEKQFEIIDLLQLAKTCEKTMIASKKFIESHSTIVLKERSVSYYLKKAELRKKTLTRSCSFSL